MWPDYSFKSYNILITIQKLTIICIVSFKKIKPLFLVFWYKFIQDKILPLVNYYLKRHRRKQCLCLIYHYNAHKIDILLFSYFQFYKQVCFFYLFFYSNIPKDHILMALANQVRILDILLHFQILFCILLHFCQYPLSAH